MELAASAKLTSVASQSTQVAPGAEISESAQRLKVKNPPAPAVKSDRQRAIEAGEYLKFKNPNVEVTVAT